MRYNLTACPGRCKINLRDFSQYLFLALFFHIINLQVVALKNYRLCRW